MKSIQELNDLLSLEKIEENIFRGNNFKTPWGRVFGGQVLSQSIHAASMTVTKERSLHSMHGYFILAGDVNLPIIYDVDRIRDGGSFTTRRVVAIQKGRAIFNMAASYQNAKQGLDHQIPMPNVANPEKLQSDQQLYEKWKIKAPKDFKSYYHERPIEFRPVEYYDPFDPRKSGPFQHVWLKSKGRLSDDPRIHQEILAYASDYNLLRTATLPHRDRIKLGSYFMASLDHAMWFHRDFRVDDWLLYQMDSPSASNCRGFSRGNIFDRNGTLVASVVQEGLISPKR